MPATKPVPKPRRKTPAPSTNGTPAAEPVTTDAYPRVYVDIHDGKDNLPLATVEQMEALLGWEQCKTGEPGVLPCTDRNGKHFRMTRVTRNREFRPGKAVKWMQEILNQRWELNGENIIVGRQTGEVISGQHRGVGLKWAEQERARNPDKWRPLWGDGPVTMPCTIMYGVDESDRVVNTVDTGVPRSDKDVLYRSHYFSNLDPKEWSQTDRRNLARMVGFALTLLWDRTGAGKGYWTRTHAETMDWLGRHTTLVELAKDLYKEDSKGYLKSVLQPGTALGLYYLLAASATNTTKYTEVSPATEDNINWKNRKKARAFMLLLCKESPQVKAVRDAISKIINVMTAKVVASTDERLAIVCLAWDRFLLDKPITTKDVDLNNGWWETDLQEGIKTLTNHPIVGGIDLGWPEPGGKKEDKATPATVGSGPAGTGPDDPPNDEGVEDEPEEDEMGGDEDELEDQDDEADTDSQAEDQADTMATPVQGQTAAERIAQHKARIAKLREAQGQSNEPEPPKKNKPKPRKKK